MKPSYLFVAPNLIYCVSRFARVEPMIDTAGKAPDQVWSDGSCRAVGPTHWRGIDPPRSAVPNPPL